jgi:hypothetical protein
MKTTFSSENALSSPDDTKVVHFIVNETQEKLNNLNISLNCVKSSLIHENKPVIKALNSDFTVIFHLAVEYFF